MSVNGPHHALLLVSDLGSAELAQLSRAVSVPLSRQLEAGLVPDRVSFAAIREAIPIVDVPLYCLARFCRE